MKRYSARLNLNTVLAPKWNMGVSVSLNKLDNHALAASSIYAAAIKKAPNLPVYDEMVNTTMDILQTQRVLQRLSTLWLWLISMTRA